MGTAMSDPNANKMRQLELLGIVQAHLDSIPSLSMRLAAGEQRVF